MLQTLRLFFVPFLTLLCFVVPSSAETIFETTCASGLRVKLALPDDSLQAFKPVQAVISIEDSQQKPVPGAKVYCSLYMPAVATGGNHPIIKESHRDGEYLGPFVFTAAGRWITDLTINLPQGGYDSALLDLGDIGSGMK